MEAVFLPPDRALDILPVWLDAFPGDTAEDVGDFLQAMHPKGRCLVMQENGKPVSMVFLLPAMLEFEGCGVSPLPLQYIYAAATLSSFRGQGIFGKLLKEALALARSEGIQASFLRPAEPSLFNYYKKFGYRSFFYTQTRRFSRADFLRGYEFPAAEISEGDAKKTRSALLKELPVRVHWPDFLVDYAVSGVQKAGGGEVAVDGGWALCEPRGNSLFIREWLCSPQAEPDLRAAVDRRFHADAIFMRRPVAPVKGNGGEPFGMICPLTTETEKRLTELKPKFPYMGLALD